jgi:hypothetical protein
MKPQLIEGLWWDTRFPERRWLGELRIRRKGKASLRIWRSEETGQPLPNQESYPTIQGVASNGREYTLINCFDSQTQGSFFAVPTRSTIHANEVISGFHSNETDPLVATASASFSVLPEWWKQSGLKVTQGYPNYEVSYQNTEPTLLYKDDTFTVLIRTGAEGSFSHEQIQLRHSVRLEVKAEQARPLSEFEHFISSFGGLLTIACHQHCGRKNLTLIPPRQPDDPLRMGRHIAVPIYRDSRRRSSGHTLIHRTSFDGREQAMIGAWFTEARRVHDTRVLYLAGVYGSGFVETKLLLLTQAAEAFHRQFRPGLYMDPEAFMSKVLEPMRKAIPEAVTSSHRQSLDSRLKYANDYSQRRRIQELFDEFEDVLEVLTDSPGSFVARIVDHRNEFTHFPVPDPDAVSRPTDPSKVLRYNWLLRLLLEACLMTRMGFTVAEVREIVSKSSPYGQIAERFFNKAEKAEGHE